MADDADLEAILAEYDGAEDAEVDDVALSPLLFPGSSAEPVAAAPPPAAPAAAPPAPPPLPAVPSRAVLPQDTADPRLQQLAVKLERHREEAALAPLLSSAAPPPPAAAAPVQPPPRDPALYSHDDLQAPSKGHRTMTGKRGAASSMPVWTAAPYPFLPPLLQTQSWGWTPSSPSMGPETTTSPPLQRSCRHPSCSPLPPLLPGRQRAWTPPPREGCLMMTARRRTPF